MLHSLQDRNEHPIRQRRRTRSHDRVELDAISLRLQDLFDRRYSLVRPLSEEYLNHLFRELEKPLRVPVVEGRAERFDLQAQAWEFGDGSAQCSHRPGLP